MREEVAWVGQAINAAETVRGLARAAMESGEDVGEQRIIEEEAKREKADQAARRQMLASKVAALRGKPDAERRAAVAAMKQAGDLEGGREVWRRLNAPVLDEREQRLERLGTEARARAIARMADERGLGKKDFEAWLKELDAKGLAGQDVRVAARKARAGRPEEAAAAR